MNAKNQLERRVCEQSMHSQAHSQAVKLDVVNSKRQRFTEYYANGDMSEDDYNAKMKELDEIVIENSSNEEEKNLMKDKNIQEVISTLLDTNYRETHGKLVKLGKLGAKKARCEQDYQNNVISLDEYRKQMGYIENRVADIKCIPRDVANLRIALIICRAEKRWQRGANSLSNQCNRLIDYCVDKKMAVIDTFNLVDNRNDDDGIKLQATIQNLIDQNIPFSLVCDSVNNLTRSIEDIYTIESLRKRGKLELHFPAENIVLSQESSNSHILQYSMLVILEHQKMLEELRLRRFNVA